MIICGFAGVGKSAAAKKLLGVVDLESTPFQRDWETYARVAKHMSELYCISFLSYQGKFVRNFIGLERTI